MNESTSLGNSAAMADAGADAGAISCDNIRKDIQAEMLLKALRNIIVPFIQPVDRTTVDDKLPIGPEGLEFLLALKKFIASVIQSQSNQQAEITINLEDSSSNTSSAAARAVIQDEPDQESKDGDKEQSATGTQTQDGDSSKMIDAGSSGEETLDGPEHPLQLTSLNKVREALHQHVFSAMPIHMLSFNTHGSQVDITLIERGSYFSYILPELETTFNEEKFLVQLDKEKHFFDPLEAEGRVIKDWVANLTRYAILSHTWLRGSSGEVTYGDWHKRDLDANQPGYQKLANFCRVAVANHGVTLGWMDTVCINKESSAELDESIRSMYKWYQKATVRITYLAETADLADMDKDPWFKRGWTLQELLAPECTKFYGRDWKQLVEASSNDKEDRNIQGKIEIATTIDDKELKYGGSRSITRRMQWASMRQVTREEDASYSMMGLFNVNMSIAYGEGAQQAFSRLLKEIINSSRKNALEILYWAGEHEGPLSSLLPFSPKAYLHTSCALPHNTLPDSWWKPLAPLTITHLGVSIPILLMPVGVPDSIHNTLYHPVGDYYARIPITASFKRDSITTFTLLDSGNIDDELSINYDYDRHMRYHTRHRLAIGVLNLESGSPDGLCIPKKCFAVLLRYTEEWMTSMDVEKDILVPLAFTIKVASIEKVPTKEPVVFKLEHRDQVFRSKYPIHQSQFAQHGMLLLNVNL